MEKDNKQIPNKDLEEVVTVLTKGAIELTNLLVDNVNSLIKNLNGVVSLLKSIVKESKLDQEPKIVRQQKVLN